MRAALIALLLVAIVGGVAFFLTRPAAEVDQPQDPGKVVNDSEPAPAVSEPDDPTAAASTVEPLTPKKSLPLQFVEVTDSGIDFVHRSGISEQRHYPCANGSGLAAVDVDLDGNVDLYFGTGQFLDKESDGTQNRFYRSQGDWRFSDRTNETGLGFDTFTAGITVGDVDGDGFPDVYVAAVGKNQLFHNQGDGTFAAVQSSGVEHPGFAASAAFLDYDNDGLVDLYVCNYGEWSLDSNRACYTDSTSSRRMFCNPKDIPAATDVLFHNEGDGTFRNVTADSPIAKRKARSQGVLALDVNGDDAIDLYLGNDMNANALYMNTGDGEFNDVTQTAGVAYDRKGNSQAGMGVSAADINRDGRTDLIVTNYENEHNTVYLGLGGEMFEDSSHSSGAVDGAMPWVGWGVSLRDFDLDGWSDMMVTNGHVDPLLFEIKMGSEYRQPPGFWTMNEGSFEFIGPKAGSYFKERHPGRGLVVSDLDNDGDYDMVVGHQDQAPALLRNDRINNDELPGSIEVRLVGTRTNRDAIGAKVSIRGANPIWTEQVMGGGSYLSANDYRLLVPATKPIDLEVVWPGGRRSSATRLQPGKKYVIAEPTRGRNAVVLPL
ncbi:MAG: CRTAC1 family protein [Planctomycetaceae bacterium]